MKRKMVDFDNLAAANYYPLGLFKPAGYESAFDIAIDNGNVDAGVNNWHIDWTVSDRNLAEAKLSVLKRLAEYRFENESNGIVFETKSISTSRESINLINAAYTQVEINAGSIIDFKTLDGWVQYSSTQMTGMADMASAFLQTCFTAEKDVDALVNAAVDINALRVIDIHTEFDTRIV